MPRAASRPPTPSWSGALAAAAVGALLATIFDARQRGRLLDEQNAGLKRVAEVQKRTVDRLQIINAELKENEQRYKGLVDAQGDAILRKWPDGRLTFVNDAFCTVFGVAREDVLGRVFRPAFHPDDPPPLLHDYADGGDRPRARYDQRVRTAVGLALVCVGGLPDPRRGRPADRDPVGRARHHRTQGGRAHRTRRARPRRADEQGEVAVPRHDEPRDPHAHERRDRDDSTCCSTPTLGPGAALLRRDQQGAPAARRCWLDDQRHPRLLQDRGRQAHHRPLPFDLRVAVEEAADLLATRASEKGVELVVRYAPGAPQRLVGDPGRIRQILLNLAGNAIKFTEKGHVLIAVDAPEVTDKDALVRIEVQDTGIGIPADEPPSASSTVSSRRIHPQPQVRRYGTRPRHFQEDRRDDGRADRRQQCLRRRQRLLVHGRAGRPTALSTPAPPPTFRAGGIAVVSARPSPARHRWSRVCARAARAAQGFASAAEAAVSLVAARTDIVLTDIALPEGDAEACLPSLRNWLPPDAAVIALLPPAQRGRIPALKAAGATGYHVTPVRHFGLERRLAASLAGIDLDEGKPRADAQRITPQPAAGGREESRAGVQILVAEDNEINTLLTVSLIKRMGHAVDSVRDGAEALGALESRPDYDLILMDVHMPGVDGIEATRRIREGEAKRGPGGRGRVPIIALTASVMDEDRQKCLSAGMDDFLTKPLDPNALTAAIARWTKTRARAA